MSLPPPGTVLADKYRLEALLGEGGMGAVFRARHVLMDTPVALKWLRPDVIDSADARERLLREARAVARIRHPNVVHVYDVDTHQGAPFIVMELLEGESFADLIARESLPIARVIDILIEAMKGLSAAHEHGIIHRDIKPENIFIARERRHPDGIPKLLDFGVSKTIGNDFDGRITPNGHSVGTPIFMSIEQLNGTGEIDQRTDVYSFGVVLYRALTGALPFDGDTFASIVIDIATKAPVSAKDLRPDIPSSLNQVVMKAIARDREDRYPSIDSLIAALRAAEETFGHTPSSVYAAVLTPKPPAMSMYPPDASDVFYPSGRRKLSRSFTLGAVCIGLLVLGWTLFSADNEEPRAAQQPTADPTGASSPATSQQRVATPPAPAPATAARAPAAPAVVGNTPKAASKAKLAPLARPGAPNEPSKKPADPMTKTAAGGKAAPTTVKTPDPTLKAAPSAISGGARPPAATATKPLTDTPPASAPATSPADQPVKSPAASRRSRSGGLSRDDF